MNNGIDDARFKELDDQFQDENGTKEVREIKQMSPSPERDARADVLISYMAGLIARNHYALAQRLVDEDLPDYFGTFNSERPGETALTLAFADRLAVKDEIEVGQAIVAFEEYIRGEYVSISGADRICFLLYELKNRVDDLPAEAQSALELALYQMKTDYPDAYRTAGLDTEE